MRIVLRFRRARSRLSRYLGVSLGAHGLALVGVVILPYLRPQPPLFPIDAAAVELVGPIAAPASGVVATAPPSPPPEPRPAPEPEAAHTIEKIPPPQPKKKEPKPELKKKEPPAPAPPEPAPGPAGNDPPGAAGPPSGPPGPAGITALESGDPGLSWYNASIASALENAWIKPVLDGVAGVQSVIVTFEIGRDGNVFNVAIAVSSRIASLDRSALRAVQDAAPFPPPPPDAPGPSVRERVRFDLRPGTD